MYGNNITGDTCAMHAFVTPIFHSKRHSSGYTIYYSCGLEMYASTKMLHVHTLTPGLQGSSGKPSQGQNRGRGTDGGPPQEESCTSESRTVGRRRWTDQDRTLAMFGDRKVHGLLSNNKRLFAAACVWLSGQLHASF